jgi:ribosomal protein S18 acetylase RimI-like enzyme
MLAWKQTLQNARQKLFDEQYKNSHFQLQILATHPEYQRCGAGTALCLDGIVMAERAGVNISVFASPMGKRLYKNLGFRRVATVLVRADGEEESISIEAMIYRPRTFVPPG